MIHWQRTLELRRLAKKCYWDTLCHNVKGYVKGCNFFLALQALRHKPYRCYQYQIIDGRIYSWILSRGCLHLPIEKATATTWLCYCWPANKDGSLRVNASGIAEVILNDLVQHHGLSNSIASDWRSIFTSKLWSSLYYFLGTKRRLSKALHPQTNGQTERQYSTMKAYLQAFVNYKQNDGAKLLSMARFVVFSSRTLVYNS